VGGGCYISTSYPIEYQGHGKAYNDKIEETYNLSIDEEDLNVDILHLLHNFV